jgi:hypothetical protein
MSEIEELQERLRFDWGFWAPQCAKILNKQRQLVPLIPRPWQLEAQAHLDAQRAAGLPMRMIILKARKLGFSTWVASLFMQRVTQLADQLAIVCAQDTDTAHEIFLIASRIYSHLPSYAQLGGQFSIKPDLIGANFSRSGNRSYMEFGEKSRRLRMEGLFASSTLEIDTANSPEGKRGYTPSMIHLSEVARWKESATSGPGSKMLALLNALPYEPETIAVLESTANGLNFFYRRWQDAVSGQADPDSGETYVPVFVPWWRDPGCASMFSTGDARERFIETIGDTRRYGEQVEDEPALQELYDLTPEQLAWRRMMIRTQHENKVELFKQENPSSAEEAFILSGRPFFSSVLVAKAIKAAEAAPPSVRGTLRAEGFEVKRTARGQTKVPTGAVWVPEDEAKLGEELLEVWEHPVTKESEAGLAEDERRPEGAYVVFVDVAEGREDTFDEGDFHAIQVFDHRTRLQVAEYESRLDRHLLPFWVLLIALYYNRAYVAVEVNSVGVAVNDPLAKEYRYPKLYRRRRRDRRQEDATEIIGWQTNPSTKPLMEGAMGSALESDTRGGLRSVKAARQLTTYIRDEKGRRGAMPGEHDDLLMAAMGAHQVMEEYRVPKEPGKKKAKWQPTDDVSGY